jgi:hypothetical protein
MAKEALSRVGPMTERLLDGIQTWDSDHQHYTTFAISAALLALAQRSSGRPYRRKLSSLVRHRGSSQDIAAMVTYLPLMAASDERKLVAVLFADLSISEQLSVSSWSIDHICAVTLAERDMGKSVTFYQAWARHLVRHVRQRQDGSRAGRLSGAGRAEGGRRGAEQSLRSLPLAPPHSDPASSWSGGGARPFWRADGASILALKE